MEKILKRVAIAAGAGLALGLSAISPPPARRDLAGAPTPHQPSSDDILDLEPLLDRIEVLERRYELAAVTAPEVVPPANFDAAIEQSRRETLDAFSQTIEAVVTQKLNARLEPLERAIADHSVALADLRERVEQTDANLQRLVVVIERLFDRDSAPPPAAANGSFEDHLDQALNQKDARRRFPVSRIL